MSHEQIWEAFVTGMKGTTALEYIAVFSGIASVWYSRKENILVYPVGLISTVVYIYLSYKNELIGEATVNLYYTIMSIYGWALWARKDESRGPAVHITFASRKEWGVHLLFFGSVYIAYYLALSYLKQHFYPGAIPEADSFASATAFTGMWLMAKKKVESWFWWIATNIASIPLYFVKGMVFTSVFYFVLLLMACWGGAEWKKRARTNAFANSPNS